MSYTGRQSGYSGSRSNQQSNQQRTQQQDRSQQQNSTPPPAGAGNQAPALFAPGKQKLFQEFAERFGVDVDLLIDTMKKTCFRGQKADSPPITNEQLVALLIVADQYKLNPFTKEIYAYPDKGGGIVPVVSVDGWIRIIQEHPQYDGMDIRYPEEMIEDTANVEAKYKHKRCWEWIEVTIFRKDRNHQTPVVEFFDEIYRPPLNLKNHEGNWYMVPTPWQSHTKRMMRHKGIIQSGRVTFGFAGIYDDDEAQRIIADDSVVATVPPGGSRPATHTDAAAEALRRRGQTKPDEQSQPRPQSEAGSASTTTHRPGSTPAAQRAAEEREHRSSQQVIKEQNGETAKARGNNPWDEPDERAQDEAQQRATAYPPINEKERWISLFVQERSLDEVQRAWDHYVNACDEAGISDLDLDVEAQYQIRSEHLQGK